MQSILEQIEEYLIIAISKQCIKFDKINYIEIINSYKLLGKSQTFVDQLMLNFLNSIQNCSMKTITDFLIDNYSLNMEEIKRKKYKELCEV